MPDPAEQKIPMNAFFPYVIPFIVFAGFTYLVPVFNLSRALVYPAKTLAALVLMIYFWPRIKHEIRPFLDLNAVMAGIVVFILWVGMEDSYPKIGVPGGFNPFEQGQGTIGWVLMGTRMLGAVLVVPVMEELFWRSFALRFLMDTYFTRIALGSFTWFSFIFVSIAFGLEHHRWLPGILGGMIYALLLYQKKNLFSPILAHAVTNLLLGIYVIINGEWGFW